MFGDKVFKEVTKLHEVTGVDPKPARLASLSRGGEQDTEGHRDSRHQAKEKLPLLTP